LFDFALQPLISKLFNEPVDYSAWEPLKGNKARYIKMLVFVWLSAAISEEIIYRGFLIYLIQKLFRSVALSLFIAAVLFGMMHFYQGLSGVITTFAIGLMLGIIYYKYNKNIYIPILIHGFIDTVFITLAYKGYLDYYADPYSFLTRFG